ncbi:sugar phosphate isomerase/epimerase [Actinocrinis puniceicyclus]|uniref:Sugar phosphate isomerase/epimerase n=1 Tax=Actinocrinis puniceicyclus TaxID=977794 RepID=A0A8J7WJG9_9ACTN|nr:sugar phosphate isomerase/epimerase [Actinocrinis puniceicyclus]MBS2963371.1 sugar phosphate isomerase/epimerase [Actinocrinis puniceicyclus]
MSALPAPARLALNSATTKRWSAAEAIEGCARAGIPGIGLWRDQVAASGLERTADLIWTTGVKVSSLCRGGFFTAADERGRRAAIEDNLRAVEEAAQLGTDVLILVCGGLPPGSRDLAGARRMVADGIAQVAPYAEQQGVRLAIEPLHPMFCADRSVVCTLGQALDLAEEVDGVLDGPIDGAGRAAGDLAVGVAVDTYHVWWDPQLHEQIARAGRRILAFQVGDWTVPLPADALLGRGHVGDGHIDVREIADSVAKAGYTGYTEVEIFSQRVWDTPGDETLHTLIERYEEYLAS